MRRYQERWSVWDRAVAMGVPREHIVTALSDDSIIMLLASETEGRRLERDILATEALNRARRTRRAVQAVSRDVRGRVAAARAGAEAAAEKAHEAEAATVELEVIAEALGGRGKDDL